MSTPRQLARILLIAACFLSWFGAVAIALWGSVEFWPEVLIGASAIVPIYLAYFLVAYQVYTGHTPHSGEAVRPDSSSIRRFALDLDEDFKTGAARFYFQMILSPQEHISRMVDNIQPATRSYDLTRTLSVCVAADLAGQQVPVPIMLAPKRSLVNRLSVVDPDGHRYSTLSQDATIAHSLVAVRRMVASIRGGSLTPRYLLEIDQDVLEFLCRNEHVEARDADLLSLVNKFRKLSNRPRSQERISIIIRYLHVLATHYPIVVYTTVPHATVSHEITGGILCRYRLSRRMIPVAAVGLTGWDRFRETVRSFFGIQSSQVILSLNGATQARSYHLECAGPEGSYLARQTFMTDGRAVQTLDLPYQMLARCGQRFGHLYVHNYRLTNQQHGLPAASRIAYAASFYERPPGSIAWATVSAFTSLVLILISAISRVTASIELDSDIVAVLLALPVVAGAWIGLDRQNRSVFIGSLGARLSLLFTMMVSLAAAIAYLLGPRYDVALKGHPWFDQPASYFWVPIVAVAGFNFVGGLASFVLRSLAYRHFISRSSLAD